VQLYDVLKGKHEHVIVFLGNHKDGLRNLLAAGQLKLGKVCVEVVKNVRVYVDAVLLVLASDGYRPETYINDYDEFRKEIQVDD
jgi:hypothetical protein